MLRIVWFILLVCWISSSLSFDSDRFSYTDQCECGQAVDGTASCEPPIASRVVGGQVVSEGLSNESVHHHPWQAYLEICRRGLFGTTCFACGGTLISRRHVITAQHCLRDILGRVKRDVRVYLGLLRVPDFKPDPSKAIKVAEIILHPQYRAGRIENDLAILKLEKSVRLNEHIRTICLPSMDNNDYDHYVGRVAVVTGFGDTVFRGSPSEELVEGFVEILDNDDETCVRSVATGYVPRSKLCAGAPHVDACQGDSGGPLVLKEKGKCTLVGITSYGIDCAKEGYVGVYTRVSIFMDFIRRHVDESECLQPLDEASVSEIRWCDLTCTTVGSFTGKAFGLDGMGCFCTHGQCHLLRPVNGDLCALVGYPCRHNEPLVCNDACNLKAYLNRADNTLPETLDTTLFGIGLKCNQYSGWCCEQGDPERAEGTLCKRALRAFVVHTFFSSREDDYITY